MIIYVLDSRRVGRSPDGKPFPPPVCQTPETPSEVTRVR